MTGPGSFRLLVFVAFVVAGCAGSFNCSRGNDGRDAGPPPGDGASGSGGSDAAADSAVDATVDACASPPGEIGSACACGQACAGSARCQTTCAVGGQTRAICLAPAAEVGTCACGAVLDDRCTGGAACLCPRSCDGPGLCLTSAQRSALCAGPNRNDFACP